jgi:hypothetical protein
MKTKTSALRTSLLLAVSFFLSPFGGTALAQSEGFETLMLNGNRIGDALIVTPTYFGISPTQGTHALLLTTISTAGGHDTVAPASGNNAALVTEMDDFLGISLGEIRNKKMDVPQATGQEGSAFELDLGFIPAGMVITFDYNFLTADSQARDFAFYTLTGLAGETFTFADTFDVTSATTGAGNPFNLQIGTFQTVTIPITTAGNYVLGIGIADATNFAGQSGVLIDNILVVVPEPSTVGLGIAGAVLLVALRRHAKRNS